MQLLNHQRVHNPHTVPVSQVFMLSQWKCQVPVSGCLRCATGLTGWLGVCPPHFVRAPLDGRRALVDRGREQEPELVDPLLHLLEVVRLVEIRSRQRSK